MKIARDLECGSLLQLFKTQPTLPLASAMQRFLCGALCCFVLACAAPSAQLPAPPRSQDVAIQGFKIAGTVVNAVTGAPLARAKVTLADTRYRARQIATQADETGHFEFVGLPPGKYALQGSRAGFLLSSYEQHEGYSTAIVTGPEFQTDDLVLRLMPMAMITGHVFDESGDPVRHAAVRLFRDDHSEGISRITPIGGASTDDRGYFDVGVLPPGTYFAEVYAKPWYAVHPFAGPRGDAALHVSPALDVVYPITYYGGATESDGAAPIELKGGEVQDIDFRLTPVPALHFTVHTSRENATADGFFRMPMLSKPIFGSMENVPVGEIRPTSEGIEITGVPPGRYELRMFDPQSKGAEQFSEVDLEHSGQELRATQGEALGQLKVTLQPPEDEPLPHQYAIALRDAKQTVVAWQSGKPNGEVHFELLRPGKYDIVVQSPAAQFVVRRTVSSNGESSMGHSVNISSGASIAVTAELATGQVHIEGVAQKAGKPISGIMVALVPADPEAHVEWFRRDQSDLDGTFSLPGVVPGNYTIVAIENAWGLDWRKPGVMARYIQHGQPLHVTEQQHGLLRLPDPVQVQTAPASAR
ncbi:MAG TPA: carboxypeptidase-like regulatory domain-containing protein [Verrucomicrobiae bacterium]|nr:carboxypeptidase-like regulatory domain-containing protein [Verrucomicrobiae bacterium]